MKFIHLSDLHLGKKVCGYSMIEDQKYILNQILQIIDSEQPQGIIIAGDVYDKSVPTVEAINLFDSFIYELSSQGVQVYVIAGNHDSVERMSFASRIIEAGGVYVSRSYDGHVQPIVLEDTVGTVNLFMLPFIKPVNVKKYFGEEINDYTDMMRAVIAEMNIDGAQRNVLVAHQFVTGASRSESEEVTVGGLDNIDGAVFDVFDYVALGHIHGPQSLNGGKVRYCGTPLKYSMSEAKHHKSVTVVELGDKGDVQVRTVELVPLRNMRSIRGGFYDVIAAAKEDDDTDDYVHIVLTDEDDVTGAFDELRKVYPNIMGMTYDNTRTRTTQTVGLAEDIENKSELELFAELFFLQNRQPMSEEQEAFMVNLINELKEGK